MCVCACVRACVRARARACVCVRACVLVLCAHERLRFCLFFPFFFFFKHISDTDYINTLPFRCSHLNGAQKITRIGAVFPVTADYLLDLLMAIGCLFHRNLLST